MKVLSATADSGNAGFDALYTGSSRDGLRVFFESAEQLAAADTDVQVDVFERSGATITRRSAGNGAFDATFAGTAADGSHVLYETEEQVLAQDTDADVDVYDSAGTTALVSTGPTGGNGPSTPSSPMSPTTVRAPSSPRRRAWSPPTRTPSPTCTSAPAARPAWCRTAAAAATARSTHPSRPHRQTGRRRSSRRPSDSPPVTPTRSADVYAARALNGYARPKGASPLRVALVPAYEPCTSPEPRARPAARIRLLRAAPAVLAGPDRRDARRERAAGRARSGSLRLATLIGDPATPGGRG